MSSAEQYYTLLSRVMSKSCAQATAYFEGTASFEMAYNRSPRLAEEMSRCGSIRRLAVVSVTVF